MACLQAYAAVSGCAGQGRALGQELNLGCGKLPSCQVGDLTGMKVPHERRRCCTNIPPAEFPTAPCVAGGCCALLPFTSLQMFPRFLLSLWQRFNPRCPQSCREMWLPCDDHERGEPKPYRNHCSSDETLPALAPLLSSLSTASPTNTSTALQPRDTSLVPDCCPGPGQPGWGLGRACRLRSAAF